MYLKCLLKLPVVFLGVRLNLSNLVPGLLNFVLKGGSLGLVEAPEVLLRLKLVFEVLPLDLINRPGSLDLV